MDESGQTCKPFDEGGEERLLDLALLPPLLARLLADKQVYAHLGPADLREMAKFDELPNIEGLAAHRIRRPWLEHREPDLSQSEQITGGLAAPQALLIPPEARKSLEIRLTGTPTLAILGRLAGASEAPVNVLALIPQSHAHLAAALQQMFWPAPAPVAAEPIDYTLFCWPERLLKRSGQVVTDRWIGHWPEARLGIIIGCDDPRLAAAMLLDAARRHWEITPGRSGERLSYLPPGKGLLMKEEDGGAQFRLLAELKCGPTAAERVASGEPFLLEEHEKRWVTPVWRNPPLEAALLAADPAWHRTALSIGALPLGVAVDREGRLPLFHFGGELERKEESGIDQDAGWIVVPRHSFPSPFPREPQRYLA